MSCRWPKVRGHYGTWYTAGCRRRWAYESAGSRGVTRTRGQTLFPSLKKDKDTSGSCLHCYRIRPGVCHVSVSIGTLCRGHRSLRPRPNRLRARLIGTPKREPGETRCGRREWTFSRLSCLFVFCFMCVDVVIPCVAVPLARSLVLADNLGDQLLSRAGGGGACWALSQAGGAGGSTKIMQSICFWYVVFVYTFSCRH